MVGSGQELKLDRAARCEADVEFEPALRILRVRAGQKLLPVGEVIVIRISIGVGEFPIRAVGQFPPVRQAIGVAVLDVAQALSQRPPN